MAVRALTVTTTVDDRQVAAELARNAVTLRLAACAQVGGPIASTYWWHGEVEVTQEWMVTFKTAAECADALVDHLVAAHPYDVPEVVVMPVVSGNEAYLQWLDCETRPR